MTIVKFVPILGLFVACAILAIALGGTPRAGDVEARESTLSLDAGNCHTEEVQLDEGYGISRKEERRVCTAAE